MFTSTFREVGEVKLPPFSGTRVMMLPIILGGVSTFPDFVLHYWDVAWCLFRMMDAKHLGKVGYLTIDEKTVALGRTHRRAGLHVDGGEGRGWGGGAPWASRATGMLTVSSHAGCCAWAQQFHGEVGEEGSCEHLRGELRSPGTIFAPGMVYWVDGMCVHESTRQLGDVDRQFIRLSLPSTAPWYEGYTENPLGVKPSGPILPRRKFMDEAA
jgi:hypothetical protein